MQIGKPSQKVYLRGKRGEMKVVCFFHSSCPSLPYCLVYRVYFGTILRRTTIVWIVLLVISNRYNPNT